MAKFSVVVEVCVRFQRTLVVQAKDAQAACGRAVFAAMKLGPHERRGVVLAPGWCGFTPNGNDYMVVDAQAADNDTPVTLRVKR